MTQDEIIDNWKAKIKQIDDSRIAIINRLNEVGKNIPTDIQRIAEKKDIVRLHEIYSYLIESQKNELQLYSNPINDENMS